MSLLPQAACTGGGGVRAWLLSTLAPTLAAGLGATFPGSVPVWESGLSDSAHPADKLTLGEEWQAHLATDLELHFSNLSFSNKALLI